MRYAVYFTPAPDTALWRFGSSVLGYDARTRLAVAVPQHGLWLEPWFLRMQDAPARYGFHATLKAPFEPAEGVSEQAILDRATAFSGLCAPLCLPALEVALLGDFVALRPLSDDPELDRMAGACVREFDDLRAPLSAADRARRLSQVLTPRQHAHLDRWGYPYVFEDFRFHMTLTGTIPKSFRARVLDTLREFHRRVSAPVWIDAITVLAQPSRESHFAVVERFPLRAAVPTVSLDR